MITVLLAAIGLTTPVDAEIRKTDFSEIKIKPGRCVELVQQTDELAKCIAQFLEARADGQISPDGRWAIVDFGDGSENGSNNARYLVDLAAARSGRSFSFAPIPGPARWVAGSHFVMGGRIWEASKRNWPRTVETNNNSLFGFRLNTYIAFSPDGRWAIREVAPSGVGEPAEIGVGRSALNPPQMRPWLFTSEPSTSLVPSDLKPYREPAPQTVLPADQFQLVQMNNGSSRVIAKGFQLQRPSFSPDGRMIVAEVLDPNDFDKNGNVRTNVVLIDIASGTVKGLAARASVDEMKPIWSPDSSKIALIENDSDRSSCSPVPTRGGGNIVVVDRAGHRLAASKLPISLTPLMHCLGPGYDYWWRKDGARIFLESQRDFHSQRLAFDLASATLTWIDATPPSLARSGMTPLGSSRSMSGDWEVYSARSITETPRVYLTRIDTAGNRMGPQFALSPKTDSVLTEKVETEIIRWKSVDGRDYSGLLFKPRGAAGSLPAVINLPGGPGTFVQGFGGVDSGLELALALRGYAVFTPFSRGRDGGDADIAMGIEEAHSRYAAPYEDVRTGIDALVARGAIDPNKIGLIGHSFGGGLAIYAATRTSRFRAISVLEPGMLNLVSDDILNQMANFSPGKRNISELFGTQHRTDGEYYRALIAESPLLNAGSIETPISMQISVTVPSYAATLANEGRLLFHALRDRHIPASLLTYSGWHSATGPEQSANFIGWQLDWLEYWIRDKLPQSEERLEEFQRARGMRTTELR